MVGCLYCIRAVARQSLIGQQHVAEEEAKRGRGREVRPTFQRQGPETFSSQSASTPIFQPFSTVWSVINHLVHWLILWFGCTSFIYSPPKSLPNHPPPPSEHCTGDQTSIQQPSLPCKHTSALCHFCLCSRGGKIPPLEHLSQLPNTQSLARETGNPATKSIKMSFLAC